MSPPIDLARPQYKVERATDASRIGAIIALIAIPILISLPWWADSKTLRLLVEFSCMLVLAQMWNLLAGYGGLVSIGQQAFFGIGGYALFVLGNHLGVNPFVCVALGGIVAALLAVPTSQAVFRLQGGYFAVGTWAVAEIYRLIVANWSFVGGGSGQSLTAMRGIPKATRESITYWIALALAIGSVALIYWLLRSRYGLALTAMRDSEIASESQGINVRATKFLVYVTAAFGCGLAGALYYMNLLRISPDAAFSVNWTAFIIFIVVIGGIGTLEGPILGTIIFFVLRELLADYGTWYLIVLGVIAVLVMVFFRRGLWGFLVDKYSLQFFPVQRRLKVLTGAQK